MLRHLRLGRRVARAQRRLDDDVRDRGVGCGITEAGSDEGFAVDQVLDVERCFLGHEVLDGGGGVGGLVEEDEADVVGRDEGGGDARGVGQQGWVYLSPLAAFDGGLSVFGRDDDEGGGEEGFG